MRRTAETDNNSVGSLFRLHTVILSTVNIKILIAATLLYQDSLLSVLAKMAAHSTDNKRKIPVENTEKTQLIFACLIMPLVTRCTKLQLVNTPASSMKLRTLYTCEDSVL